MMSNEGMRESIYKILRSHTLCNWYTGSDEHLPLVDRVSVGPDISTGDEELKYLAEIIADDLSRNTKSEPVYQMRFYEDGPGQWRDVIKSTWEENKGLSGTMSRVLYTGTEPLEPEPEVGNG